MARKRLSWDDEKVAQMEKKADPYTMNQDHTNNPIEKYQTGGPDAWAETPDMAHRWEGEGRTEDGHPAPSGEKAAHEAVMTARKLEEKAIKCITIAQRMLPGADDERIERQATDLMNLPEKCVIATLQRQTELAEVISGKKKDDEEADVAEKVKEDDDKDEADVSAKVKKEKGEDVEASKKKDDDEEADVAAKTEKKEKYEEKAKKAEEKVEEKPDEKPVEKKEEKKEEEIELNASNADALDHIFEVTASTEKTGAKTLSGLVKQASFENADGLSRLWETPPDISKVFGKA